LHFSIAELSAIGRNLWHLIRLTRAGGEVPTYATESAEQTLRACTGLRNHINALLEANAASWGQGAGNG
jgi:hypothetical protein